MQAEVIMASACFLLIIIKMWRQMNVVSEKSTIFASKKVVHTPLKKVVHITFLQ